MATFPRLRPAQVRAAEVRAARSSSCPTFELPKFDLPKIDLPEVDLPSAEQIAGFARDAAYVGVGLAVMTAERLQALQAAAPRAAQGRSSARSAKPPDRLAIARSDAAVRARRHAALVASLERRAAPVAARAAAADSLASSCPRRRPLAPRCPRAPLPVAAALLIAGIATYAFFKVGTWAVGGEDEFKPISSLWFATFALAPGLLPPARAGARPGPRRTGGRSARAASRSSPGSAASA